MIITLIFSFTQIHIVGSGKGGDVDPNGEVLTSPLGSYPEKWHEHWAETGRSSERIGGIW